MCASFNFANVSKIVKFAKLRKKACDKFPLSLLSNVLTSSVHNRNCYRSFELMMTIVTP